MYTSRSSTNLTVLIDMFPIATAAQTYTALELSNGAELMTSVLTAERQKNEQRG